MGAFYRRFLCVSTSRQFEEGNILGIIVIYSACHGLKLLRVNFEVRIRQRAHNVLVFILV